MKAWPVAAPFCLGWAELGLGRTGQGAGRVNECRLFRTFKERGEWVELRFMTAAVEHGFKVSKPWGDSSPYDVGVESGSRILRVQVKSTACRSGTGYFCQFKPHYLSAPYTLRQVDFFAAYVIPQDVWYVIPARVLLQGRRKEAAMLCPMRPLRKNRYRYERYREAWALLREKGGKQNSPKV